MVKKQRIGLARAFLHETQDKTIVLVSHRKSTMGIAEEIIAM
ncbi:hypothetical protein ACTQ6A_13300 [Lachnospiraceae bacterium LCP25S3_G4]